MHWFSSQPTSLSARSCMICHNVVADTRCRAPSLRSFAHKRKHASGFTSLRTSGRAQNHFAATFLTKPATFRSKQVSERNTTSAAASHAEPIAFAQREAVECEEEDFYSILGVPYNVDEGQLKKAYYGIMRECHPDLSQDDESLEFSTIINEIYETLKHPERRAAYDAIVGLSGDAVNPFADTSFERDQVFVDELTCIGCHNCTNVCPKTYAMEPDFGRARVMQQKIDSDDMLQESIDSCPVDCIHWVTAPQLALLENSMSKLERLNVYLLATGGGNKSGVNVFLEASIAWEKRQAGIRARRQRADSEARWAKWGAANGVATGASARAGREDPEEKRAAPSDTASAAARAARKWRDLQRNKRNNSEKLLLS